MEQIYRMLKPSIIEVVGQSVSLRRSGKEWTGLCPFHADKHPSFSVNEEKGLFYCFACGASGDVFTFIAEIEGVSIGEVLGRYRTGRRYRPQPRPHRAEAEKVVIWAHELSLRLHETTREIGQEIFTCGLAHKEAETDKSFLERYEAGLARKWVILCDLDDDLNNPKAVLELWEQRRDIERL